MAEGNSGAIGVESGSQGRNPNSAVSSSVESVATSSGEESSPPSTLSISMPDVTHGLASASDKKSWENLLTSSVHGSSEESNLSFFGLMELYNMQGSLPGSTAHSVSTSMPALVSPTSSSSIFHTGSLPSLDESSVSFRPLASKKSPPHSGVVQGSDLGGAAASSPTIERSYIPQPTGTLFDAMDKYQYFLVAPTSMMTPHDEDTITYLNKGQFYSIMFECPSQEARSVRSVVQLVFREEKDARSEMSLWEYWHSLQPNPIQRAFDVDRKACKNIDAFDDLSYNASSFIWNTSSQARVVIRMNCLSTEFSPQKGVKGMPLFMQVETFDDLQSDDPIHRSYCKLKVFRDKGAERKNKDESRSADRRMAKILKAQTGQQPLASPAGYFRAPSKVTCLSPTSTFGRKSVLFVPSGPSPLTSTSRQPVFNNQAQKEILMSVIREREAKRTFSSTLTNASDKLDDLDMGSAPKVKATRTDRSAPAVTVYVRKDGEKVYNAVMLDQLTVAELCEKIGRKYGVPANSIKYVYKRTRKGILVKIEDRMVQMFANEDDFIIQLDFDDQLGHFELILSY